MPVRGANCSSEARFDIPRLNSARSHPLITSRRFFLSRAAEEACVVVRYFQDVEHRRNSSPMVSAVIEHMESCVPVSPFDFFAMWVGESHHPFKVALSHSIDEVHEEGIYGEEHRFSLSHAVLGCGWGKAGLSRTCSLLCSR